MLINIWANILHLGDKYFCDANSLQQPGLDLLICEKLRDLTDNKQIWMTNSLLFSPGTTGNILRQSYSDIRDAVDSYLVLFTPGFADSSNNVPIKLVERQFVQLCLHCRVFRKTLMVPIIGYPQNSSIQTKKKIDKVNSVFKLVAFKYGAVVIDLKDNIKYSSLKNGNSQSINMEETAEIIVDAILNIHSSPEIWRRLHGK